ncbi:MULTISPECIES: LysR substrate-binding domain-containing protein [unclassified Streptomyces]|uniref:LysR substrate-binding domain-containing protein n=1 Tax=unclassified Streptomyces TaxID=2593676 RepID=UPI000B8680EE|nr:MULTISPECIES: LysR substrate-binding domain-containing protein [unclassified Streptomyces]
MPPGHRRTSRRSPHAAPRGHQPKRGWAEKWSRLTGPVDAALAELGLRRRVIATVPTFAASLMMVQDSEVVGLANARAAAPIVRRMGLRTLPVPLKLPPMTMEMAWHPRQEADAGHRWLRGLVRETVGDVLRDLPPGQD